MRVLKLIETAGPGGAEKVFVSLIRGLRERGQDVFACITKKGWVYDEIIKLGIMPIVVTTKGSYDLNFLKSLISIIKQAKIDIIHSHLPGANLYGSIAGFLTGRGVISTFHGMVDIENLKNNKFFKLKSNIIGFCSDNIVIVSESLKTELKKIGFPLKKMTVIYNGIDITKYSKCLNISKTKLKRTLGFSDEDIIIGKIANIRVSKGYEYFLKACAILAKDIPRVKILAIGHSKNKDDLDALKRLSIQLGIQDKVIFTGFIDNTLEIFSVLDIYVLASIKEGFSISTIEAMAAGIPVVCTRCGGPEEFIINERNGLLVPPRDPEALALAMRRIIEDKALAAKIVAEGVKTAEKFSLSVMLDKYDFLYQQLLGRKI